MRIAIWPDGIWSYIDNDDEFQSYLSWRSDDYSEHWVDDDSTEEDIEDFVQQEVSFQRLAKKLAEH